MAKCDLCGISCNAAELVQLLDSYQINGIVDICPSCRKWADKTKNDLIAQIAPRMQAAIVEKHGDNSTLSLLERWQLRCAKFKLD